ncbi:MAG: hypothetical protein V4629_11860 [Pseudomonadota bacterium]
MSDYEEDDFEEEATTAPVEKTSVADDRGEGRRDSFYDEAISRTVSLKDSSRKKLEEDMRRFLMTGGQVQQIDPNVTADPPQKPVSNYGSRPI